MSAERDGEPITIDQMEEAAYPFGCHVGMMVNVKKWRKHVDFPPNPPSDNKDKEEDGEEEVDEATNKAAA